MVGFRGVAYAGVAGADLENAPSGPVPFTGLMGLPVTRVNLWHAGGVQPGAANDGIPGTTVQRASGNPDVATVPTHLVKSPYGGQTDTLATGNPPGQMPYGRGQNPMEKVSGLPQFGWPRPLSPDQESATPRQPSVGSENDKFITYDRHAIWKVGYENSGRSSGMTDPPSDGPARPSLWLVQRSISYQQGTDYTEAADDLTRDYTRESSGRYIGEQGSGWAPVYGGVPGLWQPYGSYAGVTNGPVQGIQAPVPEGVQGDGPRKVWSGPPHGLHSPTLPSYQQTIGRYMAIPQQSLPRVDRPDNSRIAGQSYSQTVQPQGQTGTAVGGTGTSGPQFNQRAPGNGWRGRAAG